MEVKKTGKGLKVLVGILTALLVAAIGYIVVDKFILNKTQNNTTNNVVNKEVGKLSEAEIQNLYKSLIVGDKQYGFYYEDKVNIDNITENQIMPYALLRFLESKGWLNSLKTDLQCVLYPEENLNQCGGSEIPKAQKSEIDSLIKNIFNTTKTYTVEEKEPKFLGKNATSYVYMNNMYYFGYVPSSGFNRQIYSKFVKSEQDENNVYIYDKAFIHDFDGSNGNAVYLSIGGTCIIDGAASGISNYYRNGELDSEKVYNDFDSKLNTFKHTFKKAEDGKYYWYSSEIVEEAKTNDTTTKTDTTKDTNTNTNKNNNSNSNNNSNKNTNSNTSSDKYSKIITEYKNAINDSGDDLSKYPNVTDGDVIRDRQQKFKYAYYDINNDSEKELIIAATGSGEYNIIDLYSHNGTSAKKQIDANCLGARCQLKIYKNGILYMRGSSSSSEGSLTFSKINKSGLATVLHDVSYICEDGGVCEYYENNKKLNYTDESEVVSKYTENSTQLNLASLSWNSIN